MTREPNVSSQRTRSSPDEFPSGEEGPRRYHEASDLRQLLALPLLGVTVLAIAAALYAYVMWDEWTGKAAIAVVLVLVVLEVGVWQAKEWARWGVGILSALLAAAIPTAIWLSDGSFRVRAGFLVGGLAAGAWYALQPKTKAHFALVREVIARRKLEPAHPTRRSLTARPPASAGGTKRVTTSTATRARASVSSKPSSTPPTRES